ncbi:hypothetical protein DV738_g4213, partial [Chaetothyriales sp. CBS 135597]
MQMSWPYPLRSPLDPEVKESLKDYDMTSPLRTDGSNFACKKYQDTATNSQADDIKAVYQAGETYNMTITGTATHMGGSCQISLSYDNGATFKVIQSQIGGCSLVSTHDFTIPSFATSSDSVLLSWSWFNLIGNREMYQNCARVEIQNPSHPIPRYRRALAKREASLDDLPDMFVCNVGNGCTTIEKAEVVFPDPGDDVVYGEDGVTPNPGPGFTLTSSATVSGSASSTSTSSTVSRSTSSPVSESTSSTSSGSASATSTTPSSTTTVLSTASFSNTTTTSATTTSLLSTTSDSSASSDESTTSSSATTSSEESSTSSDSSSITPSSSSTITRTTVTTTTITSTRFSTSSSTSSSSGTITSLSTATSTSDSSSSATTLTGTDTASSSSVSSSADNITSINSPTSTSKTSTGASSSLSSSSVSVSTPFPLPSPSEGDSRPVSGNGTNSTSSEPPTISFVTDLILNGTLVPTNITGNDTASPDDDVISWAFNGTITGDIECENC